MGKIFPGETITSHGYFTWGEMALIRDTGFQKKIGRQYFEPSPDEKKAALFLIEKIETLIRIPLGKPIVITSGARSREYALFLREKRIPAAINGAHNRWRAIDCHVPGMKTKDFWQFCHERWPGRMELFEYTQGSRYNDTDGWVHLDTGIKGTNPLHGEE